MNPFFYILYCLRYLKRGVYVFFVFTRKNIIWGTIFAVAGISLGFFSGKNFCPETSANRNDFCVVVDAGHGSPDGGAVGAAGTEEQKINLAVAEKLCEVLEGKGIKAVMTRTDENGLFQKGTVREMKVKDMRKRLEIIKKSDADLFVSIHMNFFTSEEVSGLRIFYNSSYPEIKPLAEDIQNKMSELTKAKTSEIKPADNSLFLMKNSPIPSVLAECGFLSNKEEEKRLNNSEYQAKIAWAIAHAIEKYFKNNALP